MTLNKVVSVKVTHMQRVNGVWCMLIETGADVAWSIRDQSWHVRYNVWVSLNSVFPTSFHEFVAHSEEDMLTAMGVPLITLLSRKTYSTYTQSVTNCMDDINVSMGWYKLKCSHELSCSVYPSGAKGFVLPGEGVEKGLFFRIVTNDIKDVLFKTTMRVASVKRMDMWQRMLADPFASFSKQTILTRCACLASQLPSFLHFLRFLAGTRVKHSSDLDGIVRGAWAIYVVQKHVKRYVWRPQSRLVMMQLVAANKSGDIFNGPAVSKADPGTRQLDHTAIEWRRHTESPKASNADPPPRQGWRRCHILADQ